VYCSKVCQKKDWKEHKKICKLLNVGEGAMQVRHPEHDAGVATINGAFKEIERSLGEDEMRFFKLFKESTFEGSKAAARKMKKIAARETKHNQRALLWQSLCVLIQTNSEMLLWPNSPLLVLLQFVDPNGLGGRKHHDALLLQAGKIRFTTLHTLAGMADPTSINYSTQENQLTLGRQLIEHGAYVNATAYPTGDTPLHFACSSEVSTNLDFIQLLLEKGADPNAQNDLGRTPLMKTINMAPGAAKFLLEWPTTNVNITAKAGASFLGLVRGAVMFFSDKVALLDNLDRAGDQFVLQQWCEIEKMLVEREAVDTGITAL
jgi:hypothetical protein